MIETITKRRSVRTFKNEPLKPADIDSIQELMDSMAQKKGPFGYGIRPVLRIVERNRTEDGLKIGTYGIIHHAQGFLGAVVENQPEAMVDFGYIFEFGVLELTRRGLGTCWLGGTFTRKSLMEMVGAGNTEIMPVITPLGYAREKPNIQERLMRRMARSDGRKRFSELFFLESFGQPLTPENAGQWAEPLEMVRRGPSASNHQPWRVLVESGADRGHFYLRKKPNYPGNKLGFVIQRIDMGIAMTHLEVAFRDRGRTGSWMIQDPGQDVLKKSVEYIATFVLDQQ